MITIRYKGLYLVRHGTRVAVAKADGDVLGTFPGWTKAIAFIDRIKPEQLSLCWPMVERFEMQNTPIPASPGAGLSEDQKTWLDAIINNALQHIVETDPLHRQIHFALMVMTLERVDPDGSHIITSDTVTSMKLEHLHETLRDWVRKETQ